MNPSFDLETPDHFTAGAIGAPGQRVFYLQGREGAQLVTLKCEKEHVGALAEHLASMLAKLPAGASPQAPADLVEPVEAAWAVGSLGVGYDDARNRIVIVASEAGEQDEEEEEGRPQPTEERASARFAITHVQAAAFVERARRLVRAGRPICPMCSGPIDRSGHVCPRSNGHVVH